MKGIVAGLLLAAWVVTAQAQLFRRGPSDEQLRQMQQMQGGMQMPSKEEMAQMQRDAAEAQTLLTEMQRLQRLGRYDEAQVLSKRLDELMNSGPMGRMREQTRERSRDLTRMLPPGALPEGMDLDQALEQANSFSATDAINMERSMMRDEGLYLPEPLFVRPVMVRYSTEMTRQSARMPMKARQLLMDAYGRMQAKDYDAADAALKQAAALTPSSQILEAQARLHVMKGNPKTALRLLDTFQQRSVMLYWLQSEIQSSLGAHREAITAAERALKLAEQGKNPAELASALNNLGVSIQLSGDPKRSLELYEKAVGLLQGAMQGSSQVDSAMFRTQIPTVAANLGIAFWQLGDTGHAADAFRVALDERAWYESAGDLFMTERAQMAKAQAVAVELHALLSLDKSLGLQTLLERKGALLERRTRTQTAFRQAAGAQVEQPGAIGRLFEGPMARAERQNATRQAAEDQDVLREYESVVQERAQLAGKGARTAEDQKRITDLDMRIQVLQQRMQMREAQGRSENQPMTQAEIRDLMRKSGNNPQAITEAFEARSRQQQEAREQGAKDARATLASRVQERVPPGAVLLEMVKYRPIDPKSPDAKRPERYGTYVIKAGSEPDYVDLGEAAPLEKLIAQYRTALATPDRPSRDIARQLDQILMRPVRAKLGGATTLYVAPEGSINLAPLSALVDEEGRYLIERYTINYLASGRDLLVLGRADPSRGPALIIADPSFDVAPAQAGAQGSPASAGTQTRSRDFRSTKYDRLPGTAAEAATLQKVLTDAKLLTGTAATETAAKKIAGPRILHIATHGFFLEDVPGESEDPMLRSGLVFAGVNALSSAEDDGVLTALEASNLDLRGTKLVVLSACETGVGEVRNGEGVFGLRRAFVVAGAETLLMSLWQVADEATKDLMTSYYSRLSKGDARAEALRQAQLGLLKDAKTAHPFFWAAFISSGEAGGLK